MKNYEAQQILTESGHEWELTDEQTENVIEALCLHERDEGVRQLDHIVAQAKMIIKTTPLDSKHLTDARNDLIERIQEKAEKL